MKNQELFNRTIGILVKAYQNDTLTHGICQKCAVGNIVAANMGFSPEPKGWLEANQDSTDWYTTIGKNECWRNENGFIQIQSTGYSPNNLYDIEESFESASEGADRMFNGLMAVVDTLMIIHEANETEVKQAKELFVLT